MAKNKSRTEARKRRHIRIRQSISGTPERPRLNVYRSLAEIYAQVIDDEAGHTLVSASSIDSELRAQMHYAAVAAVMWAARELGANKVQVLHYATSGDVTGDMSSVVGYGAAVILK